MRITLLGIVLTALVGCDQLTFDEWANEDDGVLYARTNGVALHDSGTDAHAGMYGTTCEVDANSGWVGADYDYAGQDEQVQDAGTLEGKDVVVVTAVDGVHVLVKDDYYDDYGSHVAIDDVLEARLVDDGVVILSDDRLAGCTVDWADSNIDQTVSVDEDLCGVDVDMSADPMLGTVFVANSESGAYAITPTTVTEIDEEADMVVFDEFSTVVYTAKTGLTWVRGMSEDGTELWERDVLAPVVAIEGMGWRESVAVLVDDGTTSQIFVLDAYTGEGEVNLETPSGAEDMVVSRNGRSFALVRAEEVHFMEFSRHTSQ